MGFYFVTTGWIFEIGLCVNSINQSTSLGIIIKIKQGKACPPGEKSSTKKVILLRITAGEFFVSSCFSPEIVLFPTIIIVCMGGSKSFTPIIFGRRVSE